MTALMKGPEWGSTAVEITYDDCGCFCDHVSPPPGLGVRLPVVWASPWVNPGYTDSTTATLGSSLAFVEHNFGLPCMGTADCGAYDYANIFNFPSNGTSAPSVAGPGSPTSDRAKPKMVETKVPHWETAHFRHCPPPSDDT